MFRTHITRKNIKNQYSISTTDHISDNINTVNISNHNANDLDINVVYPALLKFNNQAFPSSDGNSGQVLSTNGSNVLSWVNTGLSNENNPTLNNNLTLNSNDVIGTGNINITGSIQCSSSLTCSNLNVNGTTTNINTETLTVDDPLIYLAENNNTNTLDLGWYAKYNDGSVRYAGMIRDADDGKFKIFSTTTEPTTTVSNMTYGNLQINDLILEGDIKDTDGSTHSLNSKWTTSGNNIYNNNSGNVGIGVTSPANKLDVKGNIYLTETGDTHWSIEPTNSTRFKITKIGTSGAELEINTTSNYQEVRLNLGGDKIQLHCNGDSYFNGGNVGIGTDDPSKLLEVHMANWSDKTFINCSYYGNWGGGSTRTLELKTPSSDDGNKPFRWVTPNAVMWSMDGNNSFIIDSSSNVGIGTASPANPLHISVDKGTEGIQCLITSKTNYGQDAGLEIRGARNANTDGGARAGLYFSNYDTDLSTHRYGGRLMLTVDDKDTNESSLRLQSRNAGNDGYVDNLRFYNNGDVRCSGKFFGTSGSVVKIHTFSWTGTDNVTSSSFTKISNAQYQCGKSVGTKLIITTNFDYELAGWGTDKFSAYITVFHIYPTPVWASGHQFVQDFDQHGGGGSRSNTLGGLMVETPSGFNDRASVEINLEVKKLSADDTMYIKNGYYIIREVVV